MRKVKVEVYRAVDKYRIRWEIETDETTIKSYKLERQTPGSSTRSKIKEYKPSDVGRNQTSVHDYIDTPSEGIRVDLHSDDKVHLTVDFAEGEDRQATAIVPDQYPMAAGPAEVIVRFGRG